MGHWGNFSSFGGSLFKSVVVQSLSRVPLFVTPWTPGPSCPSPTPGACSNSCPSSQWCHPTISSSVILLPSIFPRIRVFSIRSIFASGDQNIGVSASALVLPVNIQEWFPLGWTGWISLQSKGLSKWSSPTPQFKSISSSVLSFLYSPTLTSILDYWKNRSFD